MNTNYEVRSNGGALVALRLSHPFSNAPGAHNVIPAVGDRVTLRGTGTTPWRINPGSAPTEPLGVTVPQVIDTTQLVGNTPAGVNWSPRLAPAMWHWVASNNDGHFLVAADNPGRLRLSRDGGGTWDAVNSPSGLNWVSASIANSPSDTDAPGYYNALAVAAAYGGGLYAMFTSSPRGWVPVASNDPTVDFGNQEWESVLAYSNSGVAAAVLNGPIYYSVGSVGSTQPWGKATLAGSSVPLVKPWRGMANARGGQTTVAVSEDGGVYVSADGARTFTPRPITIAGSVVAEGWYRVGLSADGNTIAVAGRFGTGLYVSHDQGLTWSRAPTPTGDYTAISVSGDGRTIVATMTNGASGTGSVQQSRDGGATFAPLQMPGTDTNWRAVAISSDANFMTVAAGTFTMTTGQLYTSLGNRTSYGLGGIFGGQGSYVELEYAGSQLWKVRSSSGGPFEVR